MKICMVMLAGKFGGAERFYVDLTTGLSRRGHDVLAISRAGSVAERRLENLENLRHESIRALGTWDPFAPGKISRLIQAHGSEIIQTSLGRAAHIAGKAAQKLGVPLIAHVHNFVDLKYFKHADLLQPTTMAQRDYLMNQGVPANRIRLITNFSAFEPVKEVQCGNEVTRIVAHGRLVYKKGFDLLLKSFSNLAGDNIHLYIAGDGPERQKFRNLARALNLDKKVYFVGWQDNIRSFLLQGDLFILPSRDEPFGIALLEAMACGIPVVTTKCHGPVEILDNNSAYFCDADEEKSLTHALRTAINDPEGRRRRAQTALTLFQNRYHIDKVITKFEQLYEQARY